MILIENLAESFIESFNKNFISFCFDLAAENHCDNADQNFYCVAKSYFFLKADEQQWIFLRVLIYQNFHEVQHFEINAWTFVNNEIDQNYFEWYY